MNNPRIPSKIDWPISLLMGAVVLILIVSTMMLPPSSWLMMSLLNLPVIGFLAWLYFGTYYRFEETRLVCHSGPFTEKIAYDKIKSAKLCHNMLSSLALSVDRIEIRQHDKGYISGTTLISPINREEFLQTLISKCPNLEKKP